MNDWNGCPDDTGFYGDKDMNQFVDPGEDTRDMPTEEPTWTRAPWTWAVDETLGVHIMYANGVIVIGPDTEANRAVARFVVNIHNEDLREVFGVLEGVMTGCDRSVSLATVLLNSRKY